jgi:hypothetical protein
LKSGAPAEFTQLQVQAFFAIVQGNLLVRPLFELPDAAAQAQKQIAADGHTRG